MPAIGASQLVSLLLDAFQQSGGSGILTTPPREHPRKFIVQTPTGSASLWAYVWTLTHGGRPSLPDEYRIQMTGVASPLELNPLGYTILAGYEPASQVFAGFDLQQHLTFSTGSPSVQIDINCLHRALADGLAFDRKDNAEIAVGIRPDLLLNYVANAGELHRLGVAPETFGLLSQASALEPLAADAVAALPEDRRRIVGTVNRLARAGNFSQQVRQAYDNRCAVTRMQLRLSDAAHILPVGSPGSVDEVRNGLFLSATYHRAFDNGLIFLDETLTMRLNPARAGQLAAVGLDGGLADFERTVGRRIHLPPDANQRPDPAFIRQANAYRQIAA